MPANSANPALGTLQSPLMIAGFNMTKAVCDCAATKTYKLVENIPVDDWVKCCILGRKRQTCVEEKIEKAQKDKGPDDEKINAPAGGQYHSPNLPTGQGFCLPDFVVGVGAKPLKASQITAIYELKNPCNKGPSLPSSKDWSPEKLMGGTMRNCYENAHRPGEKPKPGGHKVEAIGPTAESCT